MVNQNHSNSKMVSQSFILISVWKDFHLMLTNKHTILVALFYTFNYFIFNFVNFLIRFNEYMYMKELMAKQMDSIFTISCSDHDNIFHNFAQEHTTRNFIVFLIQHIYLLNSFDTCYFSGISIIINFGFRIWITQYLEVLRG